MEWMVIVLYGRERNEKGVTQGNSKAVTWAHIYVSWWGLGAAERSYPISEVRGSGREDQPHVHRAVAAQVQEGLEELSHVEGQEGWR